MACWSIRPGELAHPEQPPADGRRRVGRVEGERVRRRARAGLVRRRGPPPGWRYQEVYRVRASGHSCSSRQAFSPMTNSRTGAQSGSRAVLQPGPEPVLAHRGHVQHRGRAEVHAAHHRRGRRPVRPRPDDHALRVAGPGRRRLAPHAGVVADDPVQVDVVPAADVHGGQVQHVVVGGRVDPPPVGVVAVLVLEDLVQPGGPAVPQRVVADRPDPVDVLQHLLGLLLGRADAPASPLTMALRTARPDSRTWSSSGSLMPHCGAIPAMTEAVQPIRRASRSAPPGPNDAAQ